MILENDIENAQSKICSGRSAVQEGSLKTPVLYKVSSWLE